MSFVPLRIGVLSAANIARAFTAACKNSELVDVAVVASRGLDKAEAFAKETGIARALCGMWCVMCGIFVLVQMLSGCQSLRYL